MYLLDSDALETCYGAAWYLRTDMIMFLITPILALIGSIIGNIAMIPVFIVTISYFHFNCLLYCTDRRIHYSDYWNSWIPATRVNIGNN